MRESKSQDGESTEFILGYNLVYFKTVMALCAGIYFLSATIHSFMYALSSIRLCTFLPFKCYCK